MKKILALALVLTMIFALAACGGSRGGAAPGHYVLKGLVEDGVDRSDEIAELEAFGLAFYLELKEDGTGYLDMNGEHLDMTWDESTFTFDGSPCPYTVEGDTLFLRGGDMEMTFTRK